MACVKRAQTCQRLIIDYRVIVAIDYNLYINMTWSQKNYSLISVQNYGYKRISNAIFCRAI